MRSRPSPVSALDVVEGQSPGCRDTLFCRGHHVNIRVVCGGCELPPPSAAMFGLLCKAKREVLLKDLLAVTKLQSVKEEEEEEEEVVHLR